MAQLVAFTGQSFREVRDDMTWPDYMALQKIWADWPPLPVAVAIQAGISPHHRKKEDAALGVTSDEAFAELVGLIGAPPPEA